MQLKSILATGLLCAVSLVNAEFVIITSVYTTITNEDVATKVVSALNTYRTHVAADPQYGSVSSAVHAFLATRTDVEPAVTATGVTTTIRTVPPWYTDLPSDIRSFYSSVEAAEASIISANAAPRPTAGLGYRGVAGIAAAGALGAGALLF